MTCEEKYRLLVEAVEEIAKKEGKRLEANPKLRRTFENCFVSTAKTTTEFLENGDAYVFTGDIPALWLRDSSAQVVHYLPFLKEYPILKEMVRGLIATQARYICIDPYANAFNKEENGMCYERDDTDDTSAQDWEWERKYEVDSLCYPVWLAAQYVKHTGERDIFTGEEKAAFRKILDVWKLEQRHGNSPYYFKRKNCPPSDTLSHGGKGSPVGDTGMTWSGFRPSDDACVYGYLVPSNMFAAVVLKDMAAFLREEYGDEAMAAEAEKLEQEIREGIQKYGVTEDETYGRIYAYETDGLGNYNLMDDANVPSLLSLPWLGYCEKDDPVYRNTRAFILSKKNPFYYEGTKAKGIGSPHTPERYIWHISLVMQGLTSADREERRQLLHTILETDGGCEVMHEGFDTSDPSQFTREWFAWANSLFAHYVLSFTDEELAEAIG